MAGHPTADLRRCASHTARTGAGEGCVAGGVGREGRRCGRAVSTCASSTCVKLCHLGAAKGHARPARLSLLSGRLARLCARLPLVHARLPWRALLVLRLHGRDGRTSRPPGGCGTSSSRHCVPWRAHGACHCAGAPGSWRWRDGRASRTPGGCATAYCRSHGGRRAHGTWYGRGGCSGWRLEGHCLESICQAAQAAASTIAADAGSHHRGRGGGAACSGKRGQEPRGKRDDEPGGGPALCRQCMQAVPSQVATAPPHRRASAAAAPNRQLVPAALLPPCQCGTAAAP